MIASAVASPLHRSRRHVPSLRKDTPPTAEWTSLIRLARRFFKARCSRSCIASNRLSDGIVGPSSLTASLEARSTSLGSLPASKAEVARDVYWMSDMLALAAPPRPFAVRETMFVCADGGRLGKMGGICTIACRPVQGCMDQ
jgi:hypothetical protein